MDVVELSPGQQQEVTPSLPAPSSLHQVPKGRGDRPAAASLCSNSGNISARPPHWHMPPEMSRHFQQLVLRHQQLQLEVQGVPTLRNELERLKPLEKEI